MRRTLLGLTAALVAGTGLAYGQTIPAAPANSPYGVTYGATPADGQPTLPAATSPAQNCLGGCQPECCWKVKGWLAADYLMMFPQGQPLPAGLITAPGVGIVAVAPGATLVGGRTSYGLSNGIRLEAGLWLNSSETLASQGLFDQTFRTYNTVTAPVAVINTTPGPITVGALTFQDWIQFNRADGNTWIRIASSDNLRIFGIAGTKFVSLEEDVNISYTLAGGNFFEDFHTRNFFFGGNLGAMVQYCRGKLELDAALKVGLGLNYYQTTILGRNSVGSPTQVFTSNANIGYYENSVFSAVPEVNVNASYAVTEHLSVRVGYTFLAMTNVQRPGSEISTTLGGAPYTPTRETFYQHGVNFGGIFRY